MAERVVLDLEETHGKRRPRKEALLGNDVADVLQRESVSKTSTSSTLAQLGDLVNDLLLLLDLLGARGGGSLFRKLVGSRCGGVGDVRQWGS